MVKCHNYRGRMNLPTDDTINKFDVWLLISLVVLVVGVFGTAFYEVLF